MKRMMFLFALMVANSPQPATAAGCITYPSPQPASTFPSLNGRLLYQTVASDGSSQLFMLNFATKTVTQLSSASWRITNPSNAVSSVDGDWITFMGVQHDATNIFMYRLGSTSAPVNLTQSTGSTKNEDPKFSADGTEIFFKQTDWPSGIATYSIKVAPLIWSSGVPSLGALQTLVSPSATIQSSMPFPSPDSSILYFSTISDSMTDVVSMPINPVGSVTYIDGGATNPAFYPIVRNDGTVFYTMSIPGQSVQILMRAPGASSSTIPSFNDCKSDNEDAAPVNGTNYVFFSSTTAGGFQLYLGDAATGKRWSLTPYGVNFGKTKGKIGASYR